MVLSGRLRTALTLIELLVVIAIIAILIGLLVPAVQKVREAAARAQCSNNLKQLGLACHMYQDSRKKLPPGWVTSTSAQPSPGWSWATVIMPYIEQSTLFNAIAPDVATPGGVPAVNAALATPVPVYQCPSDGGAFINPYFQGGGYAKNNYVCNRWVLGPNSSSLPANLSIQGISDGSSNTILLGERDMTINVGAVCFRSSTSSCSFEGRPGAGMSPQPASGSHWTTGDNQRLAFSSMHTGGCNFVFADGSVHFIPTAIDSDPNDSWANFPTLDGAALNFNFARLMIPNDGLPVDASLFQ